MSSPILEDRPVALQRAFEMGREQGSNLKNIAGNCPFDHERFDLRTQWMDDFAAGRKAAK